MRPALALWPLCTSSCAAAHTHRGVGLRRRWLVPQAAVRVAVHAGAQVAQPAVRDARYSRGVRRSSVLGCMCEGVLAPGTGSGAWSRNRVQLATTP